MALNASWRETDKRERERGEKEEEEEAEEEGNRRNDMFPITGVEEDGSGAWIDLRDTHRGKCSLYAVFLVLTFPRMKERDTKRKRRQP